MTNLTDKLAALSEAATQGEWVAVEIKGYGFSQISSMVDGHKEWPCGDVDDNEALFIVALVNAYRTGQLIPLPDRDAAIERMARAMIVQQFYDGAGSAYVTEVWREQATAAYDAMFDGPAPTGNPQS